MSLLHMVGGNHLVLVKEEICAESMHRNQSETATVDPKTVVRTHKKHQLQAGTPRQAGGAGLQHQVALARAALLSHAYYTINQESSNVTSTSHPYDMLLAL